LTLARLRLAPVAAALAISAPACTAPVYRIGEVAPAPPARPAEVRVLVLGDFGLDTLLQRLVSRAIRAEGRARPFDLAVQLGDNLYYCGPDPTRPAADACRFGPDGATVVAGYRPPDDPLFRVNEAPLEGLRARGGGPLPIYLALGNHDVGWGGGCAIPGLGDDESARRRACLEVAHRTPAWIMPGRHYVVDRGPLRLVVVDTNVVVADYGGFTLDDEIAFVRSATAECGAGRFCFLAGHHPPAVVHGYGRGRAGPSPYGVRMARLVAAAGERAAGFLAGHVHTLEHVSLGPLDVFVSGSTAMGGFDRFRWQVPASARPHFVTSAWGYAVLEADAAGWWMRFRDFRGEDLYCCAAERDGPCVPVECR
jgi:3',5'-cyclic AMP phosphodiesterase CpdA